MGLHIDSTLSITTNRRFKSAKSTKKEEVRVKYKLVSHHWLLAFIRQPGRAVYRDVTCDKWPRVCDEVQDDCSYVECLNPLRGSTRKEAIRLTRDLGYRGGHRIATTTEAGRTGPFS